jgi:hypothetical protein
MRPQIALLGMLLVVAPAVLAQNTNTATDAKPPPPANTDKPSDAKPSDPKPSEPSKPTEAPKPTEPAKTTATQGISDAPALTSSTSSSSSASSSSGGSSAASTNSAPPLGAITDAPVIDGVGIPPIVVPNTAGAPYMQKSSLPDGTIFICVGAILAFLGAAVLLWRALVAWSLHRSVQRAAMAQNMADLKAQSAVPGKKRGMYNVVGASSNMSLDHLSAAPPGTSRPPKPFASNNGAGTPPRSTTSLFFSPTAGGSTGLRDSVVNRSSTYLPAGYYASGNAQPQTHPGHLSTYSLHTPGNRISTRSGVSPPVSPSLPPSRGYDRAPPSRDGISMYDRNSVANLGVPSQSRGVYQQNGNSASQLSLTTPGGTHVPGGRAPSAYLEDLFESHGNGPRTPTERH